MEDTPSDSGRDVIDRNLWVSSAHKINSAEIFYNRLATRTQRISAKSIAATPAGSILFIGVAVLIADTVYELYSDLGMVHYIDTAITPHVKKIGKHQKIKLYS
jgi:hypothetical protein